MAKARRERARERHKRKAYVRDQLKLQASLLCESHTDQQTLQRMLAYIIELLPRERINDERRDSLGRVFEECAYGGSPTIMIDKEFDNMLFINGHFDVKELSKRLVWGDSVSGQMLQEVGGES